MSVVSDTLERIRDDLLSMIETQTTAWTTAGCPPTFSVDGESYDWNGWLASKLDAVEKINQQIARHKPFAVISRMRG